MSRLLSVRNAGRIKLRPRHTSSTSSNTFSNSILKSATYTNAARSNIHNSKNSLRTQCENQSARRFNSNAKLDRERNISAAQLQLNVSPNASMPTLSELTAWVLHKVKVPKGEFGDAILLSGNRTNLYRASEQEVTNLNGCNVKFQSHDFHLCIDVY